MGILEILIGVIVALLGTTGWFRHRDKQKGEELKRVQNQVQVVQERAAQAETQVVKAKELAHKRDDITEKYVEQEKQDAVDISEGRRDQLDNAGRVGVRKPAGKRTGP